jgi:uncharacterized membrane protein YdjX (TVP38/TMEM64 family)
VGGVVWLVGRVAGSALLDLLAGVEALGPAAPLAFGALYVVAVVAMVPGSVLTLAAGALFGVWRGALIVFLAATVGATIAFLVSRYVARPAIERRIAGDSRLARIDAALEGQGTKIVLLLRLSPVIPFSLLNYALGVTRVRLGSYVLGSLGMVPGTILYVYSGRVAGEIVALGAGAGRVAGAGSTAVLVGGLVATALLVVLVTRVARGALDEAAGKGSGSEIESTEGPRRIQ